MWGPVNLVFLPKVPREREHRGGKPSECPAPVLQWYRSRPGELSVGIRPVWQLDNELILVFFSPIKSREDRIIDLLVQKEVNLLFFPLPNKIAV